MKMLIMTAPYFYNTSERYEFKTLVSMAKEAGFQLRVAERRSNDNSQLSGCVDYLCINARHKADVDEAFKTGTVYVVNGMVNMISKGAVELCTMDCSPIEKLAKIIGKTLSREEQIICALLSRKPDSNHKLRLLRATPDEIRSAMLRVNAA